MQQGKDEFKKVSLQSAAELMKYLDEVSGDLLTDVKMDNIKNLCGNIVAEAVLHGVKTGRQSADEDEFIREIDSAYAEDHAWRIPGNNYLVYILNKPMYKYRVFESLIAGAFLGGILFVLYLAFVYKF